MQALSSGLSRLGGGTCNLGQAGTEAGIRPGSFQTAEAA